MHADKSTIMIVKDETPFTQSRFLTHLYSALRVSPRIQDEAQWASGLLMQTDTRMSIKWISFTRISIEITQCTHTLHILFNTAVSATWSYLPLCCTKGLFPFEVDSNLLLDNEPLSETWRFERFNSTKIHVLWSSGICKGLLPEERKIC
jgi:hypothetical protein